MAKQIVVNVVFLADGTVDRAATDAQYEKLRDELSAAVTEDFDVVAVDVENFLRENPGLKTIPTPSLARGIWDMRIEEGRLRGKTHQEKSALYDRLLEVLPEYIRANPDKFHMGRKTGIAVRYVLGEHMKDAEGNVLLDGNGEPVQAYRHSAEEWAKLTAPKEKKGENGATAAA